MATNAHISQRMASIHRRRQKNARAPIHSLPAELFLEILLLAFRDSPQYYERPARELHRLARVCSYWYHSVVREPRFWRSISASESPVTAAALARNPTGPISITIPGMEKIPTSFLSLIVRESHRWTSFSSTSRIMAKPPASIFCGSFPALEVFNLCGSWGSTISPTFSSRLKHLSLRMVNVDWRNIELSGLKSLFISEVDISFLQLREILQRTSNLEWLQIEMADSDDETTSLPMSTIHMPALRGLFLHMLEGTAGKIAGVIYSPILHYYCVSIDPDCLSPSFIENAATVLRLSKVADISLLGDSEYEVVFRDILHVGRTDPISRNQPRWDNYHTLPLHIELTVYDLDIQNPNEWKSIQKLIAHSTASPIPLRVDDPTSLLELNALMGPEVDLVRSIILSGSFNYAEEALQKLSTLNFGAWPFPKIERLEIRQWWYRRQGEYKLAGELANCLSRRAEGIAVEGEEIYCVVAPVPVPVVRGSREILEELAAIPSFTIPTLYEYVD